MLKLSKSISISGQCLVEVTDENGNVSTRQVAYMNATVPENGETSVNKFIQNKELFNANKETVIADLTEFETYVYNLTK